MSERWSRENKPRSRKGLMEEGVEKPFLQGLANISDEIEAATQGLILLTCYKWYDSWSSFWKKHACSCTPNSLIWLPVKLSTRIFMIYIFYFCLYIYYCFIIFYSIGRDHLIFKCPVDSLVLPTGSGGHSRSYISPKHKIARKLWLPTLVRNTQMFELEVIMIFYILVYSLL